MVPAEANGADLTVCGTGTCEVEIRVGQLILVPAGFGVSRGVVRLRPA